METNHVGLAGKQMVQVHLTLTDLQHQLLVLTLQQDLVCLNLQEQMATQQ